MKETTIPDLSLASPATVRLEGALNFRDLGGLPTEDGRRVRHRHLFRSDSLARLTEGDLAIVRKLEIRLLVDLRTEAERVRNPNRWPSAACHRPTWSPGTIRLDHSKGTLLFLRALRVVSRQLLPNGAQNSLIVVPTNDMPGVQVGV
jgi:hypothetical protein